MSAPVVHFEIGVPNAPDAGKFYTNVFGWRVPADGTALLIGSGHEGGPTGMIHALGHAPETYVVIYVQVDDIEAALQRVVESGGTRLVGPAPIPDGRQFAWFIDPFGNTLGMLTPPAS